MPMEIDRKQLKLRAKESMALSKPSFWLVTLVYLLMTTGVSTLADLSTGSLATFLSIALTLYCWVVGFSYRLWALWTARRLDPGLGSLVEGFSVAGRVILLEISILVRTMGWIFLLTFPIGFIVTILLSIVTTPAMALVSYAILIGLVVLAVNIIILRYAMAPYVLADHPDLGPAIAIAHSVRMMKGWVLELFKLHLSFWGWYLLSAVLSFVGMAVGMFFTGDLAPLLALSPGEIMGQFNTMVIPSVAFLLSHVVALPVTLYFTPYLEVTLAEFYAARISLPDNMADPMAGIKMPPV